MDSMLAALQSKERDLVLAAELGKVRHSLRKMCKNVRLENFAKSLALIACRKSSLLQF